MSNQTWGQHAFNHIINKYREIRKAEPTLSDDEILTKINKDHYPYGERAYHPYKTWRKALKSARNTILTLRGDKPATELKPIGQDPNQPLLAGLEE